MMSQQNQNSHEPDFLFEDQPAEDALIANEQNEDKGQSASMQFFNEEEFSMDASDVQKQSENSSQIQFSKLDELQIESSSEAHIEELNPKQETLSSHPKQTSFRRRKAPPKFQKETHAEIQNIQITSPQSSHNNSQIIIENQAENKQPLFIHKQIQQNTHKLVVKAEEHHSSHKLKSGYFTQKEESHQTDEYLSSEEKQGRNILHEISTEDKIMGWKTTKDKLNPLKVSHHQPIHSKSNYQNKIDQANSSSLILINKNILPSNQPKNENSESMVNMQSLSELIPAESFDVKNYSFSPIPKSIKLYCQFFREKQFCKNYLHPQYWLISNSSSEVRELLFAKLDSCTLTSRFSIHTRKDNQFSDGIEGGYLIGNAIGSRFNLYKKVEGKEELVCTIRYKVSCSCKSEVQSVQIFLKGENYSYESMSRNAVGKDLEELYEMDDNASAKRIYKLVNKQPIWSEQMNCFTMNFKGKWKMPSTKNIVIVDQKFPKNYLLLLCKNSANEFYAEISYPFSAFTAMGVILSCFAFKLASQ